MGPSTRTREPGEALADLPGPHEDASGPGNVHPVAAGPLKAGDSCPRVRRRKKDGQRTGSRERAAKPSPMRAPPPRTREEALPQTASRSPEVGQSQSPLRGSHNLGWDSLQDPHFHPPSPAEDSPLSACGAPDTGSDAPGPATGGEALERFFWLQLPTGSPPPRAPQPRPPIRGLLDQAEPAQKPSA